MTLYSFFNASIELLYRVHLDDLVMHFKHSILKQRGYASLVVIQFPWLEEKTFFLSFFLFVCLFQVLYYWDGDNV